MPVAPPPWTSQVWDNPVELNSDTLNKRVVYSPHGEGSRSDAISHHLAARLEPRSNVLSRLQS